MTPNERLEALVKYALEAFDKTDEHGPDIAEARKLFEQNVRERMAQAAQVWTNEVDDLKDDLHRENEASHRAGNIGAFFTRKEPLLKFTPVAEALHKKDPRAVSTPALGGNVGVLRVREGMRLAILLDGRGETSVVLTAEGAHILARQLEATDMPPHPIHFEPGDPNVGRQCIRCGNNIPAGCRYVHADWCNKREKKG